MFKTVFWNNQKLQGSRILADLPQIVQQEVGIFLGFENMVFDFEVPGHFWTVMQSVNLDVHSLLEHSQKRITQCRAGSVNTLHIK